MSVTKAPVEPRDSPYFGLDYYQEKFGAWFFGREAEGGKVITNLRAARLTLLHAESGVGKSSLLRAGVAWRMRRLADRSLARRSTAPSVPSVCRSWKDDPVPQLVSAISAATRPYLAGNPDPKLPTDRLDAAIEAASSAANASLFLMLDQFEEYFLYCAREPTPERFADQLATCINRTDLRANFLIAIREDAYAGLGDLFKGRIANVYGNYLHVDYLDRPSAEKAIREPLEIYNSQPGVSEPVRIQDELVEAVLNQVRAYDSNGEPDPGRAAASNGSAVRVSTPLLQLVMETVWQRERAEGSHELRSSTLQDLRGVRMIVDTHLGKALSDLGSSERQTAVDLFDHLVTPSGGKIAESIPDLAKRTGHSEDQVDRVLGKLDDSRIVRPVPAPPGQDPMRFRRYEIFHDVLAPAINHAIAAREERRHARRLKRLAALAVGLLIVTLAIVGVFVFLWHSANAEKLTAESRELTADADVNLTRDPGLSALLALKALHLQRTSQAEAALRAALSELQEVRSFRVGTEVISAMFDPVDANKVASADRYGIASIWDVKTGHRMVRMSLGGFNVTGAATALAFNPTGTEIAVGYAGGQVAIFDARSGRKLQSASLAGSAHIYDVEFLGSTGELAIATQRSLALWQLPSGSRCCHILAKSEAYTIAADPRDPLKFVVTSPFGKPVIWGLSGPGKPRQQELSQGSFFTNDAVFSPDGSEIVTAEGDGKVRVFSLHPVKTVTVLDAGETDSMSVAFSPDGGKIVAGYASGMARVWDVSTRLQLTPLAGHAASIDAVRFSADGSDVVTASSDGTLRVWHSRPIELQREFAISSYIGGGPDSVAAAQYISRDRIIVLDNLGDLYVYTPGGVRMGVIAPDAIVDTAAWNTAGTQMATADNLAEKVDVWHAVGSGQIQMRLSSTIPSTGLVQDLEMSPDGSRVTILSRDNWYAIQLRSSHNGKLLRTLEAVNSLSRVAFSPDGRQIFAGDYNGQVEVWSAATGHRRLLGKPGPSITDIEFDSRGNEFVTASASGTVTVWPAHGDRPMASFYACRSLSMASPSFDGTKIVVACGDGSAPVFDAATGQQLTVLPATSGGTVSSVGFSPNGKSIITVVNARETGGVQIWNAELANASASKIERIARQRITRQLTQSERQQYLTGISG